MGGMSKADSGEVTEAVRYLESRVRPVPRVAVILGSGLSSVAERLGGEGRIPYRDIPGFPSRMTQGHRGELLFGGCPAPGSVAHLGFKGSAGPAGSAGSAGPAGVLVFNGRFHCYQGYTAGEVVLPVRVAKRLGVEVLIVTNACGGINRALEPGDIMLIRDHINCMGVNPLAGADPEEFGAPFVDMGEPYSLALAEKAKDVARARPEIGELKEGVYLATLGPSYETKAEIEFFKRIGADAVGMSTVPEAIAAAQEGLELIGLSVVANLACGVSEGRLSHGEVLASMEKAAPRVGALLEGLIGAILSPPA